MKGRAALLLLCAFVLPLSGQTPPTTSPPAPTPVPTIVPANPVGAAPAPATASSIVVHSFDSVTQWTPTRAEGVDISLHPHPTGGHGRAMRVGLDFHGHGGGCGPPRRLRP